MKSLSTPRAFHDNVGAAIKVLISDLRGNAASCQDGEFVCVPAHGQEMAASQCNRLCDQQSEFSIAQDDDPVGGTDMDLF
jgi:hypothetical protein